MNQKKIYKNLQFKHCLIMLQKELDFCFQKHLINKKSCKIYFNNQVITNSISNSNLWSSNRKQHFFKQLQVTTKFHHFIKLDKTISTYSFHKALIKEFILIKWHSKYSKEANNIKWWILINKGKEIINYYQLLIQITFYLIMHLRNNKMMINKINILMLIVIKMIMF